MHSTGRVRGSSPRGRGTRCRALDFELSKRVIPAWAGNTTSQPGIRAARTGHPRVGGEHAGLASGGAALPGSSPRGRGTHAGPLFADVPFRVIPAWAGNTTFALGFSRLGTGHPRVGGEHCVDGSSDKGIGGSSPRGRGTRRPGQSPRWRAGVIPAWAGNTEVLMIVKKLRAGHPRVGGEHTYCNPMIAICFLQRTRVTKK